MSDFTQADLDAINRALANNVKTVKYSDKEVTYRSVDEMIKIRDMIRQSLGINRGGRRVARTSKGLG